MSVWNRGLILCVAAIVAFTPFLYFSTLRGRARAIIGKSLASLRVQHSYHEANNSRGTPEDDILGSQLGVSNIPNDATDTAVGEENTPITTVTFTTSQKDLTIASVRKAPWTFIYVNLTANGRQCPGKCDSDVSASCGRCIRIGDGPDGKQTGAVTHLFEVTNVFYVKQQGAWFYGPDEQLVLDCGAECKPTWESWPDHGYSWHEWDSQPRSRVKPSISCDASDTLMDPVLLVRWMSPLNMHHFHTDTVLTTFMTAEYIAKVLGYSSKQVKVHVTAGLGGTSFPEIWNLLFTEARGADLLDGCYKRVFYGHMFKNILRLSQKGTVYDPTLSSWMRAFQSTVRAGLVPSELFKAPPGALLFVQNSQVPNWLRNIDWGVSGVEIEKVDLMELAYKDQISKVAVSRGLLSVGGLGVAQHLFLRPGSPVGWLAILELADDKRTCRARLSQSDPSQVQAEETLLAHANSVINAGHTFLMWRWCRPDIFDETWGFTSQHAQVVLNLLLSLNGDVRVSGKVHACYVLDGNPNSDGWPRCDQHLVAPAPPSAKSCEADSCGGLPYNLDDYSSYTNQTNGVKFTPYTAVPKWLWKGKVSDALPSDAESQTEQQAMNNAAIAKLDRPRWLFDYIPLSVKTGQCPTTCNSKTQGSCGRCIRIGNGMLFDKNSRIFEVSNVFYVHKQGAWFYGPDEQLVKDCGVACGPTWEGWPMQDFKWYEYQFQPRERIQPSISCDATTTAADPALLARWFFPWNPYHFYTDSVLSTYMTVGHIANVLGCAFTDVKVYLVAGLFPPKLHKLKDIWTSLFSEALMAEEMDGCYKRVFYGHMWFNVPAVNMQGTIYDPVLSSWMAAWSRDLRAALLPLELQKRPPEVLLRVNHSRAPDWFQKLDFSIPGVEIDHVDFEVMPYKLQVAKVAGSRGLFGIGGAGFAQQVFLSPGSMIGYLAIFEQQPDKACKARLSRKTNELQGEENSLCYANSAINLGNNVLVWRWCRPDIFDEAWGFASHHAQAVLKLLLSLKSDDDTSGKVHACYVLDGNPNSDGWPRCDQHITAPAPHFAESCKSRGCGGRPYNIKDNSSYLQHDSRVQWTPYTTGSQWLWSGKVEAAEASAQAAAKPKSPEAKEGAAAKPKTPEAKEGEPAPSAPPKAKDGLEGTWVYENGEFSLKVVDQQHCSFREGFYGEDRTGLLTQDGQWYEGPISIGSRPLGFIRIQRSTGKLLSNFRANTASPWGPDITSVLKEPETTVSTTVLSVAMTAVENQPRWKFTYTPIGRRCPATCDRADRSCGLCVVIGNGMRSGAYSHIFQVSNVFYVKNQGSWFYGPDEKTVKMCGSMCRPSFDAWPSNGYDWYEYDNQPRARKRPKISCDASNTITDPVVTARWMFPNNAYHFYTDYVLATYMTVGQVANVHGCSHRQVQVRMIAGMGPTFFADLWAALFDGIHGADELNGCYKTVYYGHMYHNVPFVNEFGTVYDPTLSQWMAAWRLNTRAVLVPASLANAPPGAFLLVYHGRAPDWFQKVDWSIPDVEITKVDFGRLPYKKQIATIAPARGLLGVGGSGMAQQLYLRPGSLLGYVAMFEARDGNNCLVRMSKIDPAHVQQEDAAMCYVNIGINMGNTVLMWRWCRPDIFDEQWGFASEQAQAVLKLLISLKSEADNSNTVHACYVLDGNVNSAGWPRCDQHVTAPRSPQLAKKCESFDCGTQPYNKKDSSSYIESSKCGGHFTRYTGRDPKWLWEGKVTGNQARKVMGKTAADQGEGHSTKLKLPHKKTKTKPAKTVISTVTNTNAMTTSSKEAPWTFNYMPLINVKGKECPSTCDSQEDRTCGRCIRIGNGMRSGAFTSIFEVSNVFYVEKQGSWFYGPDEQMVKDCGVACNPTLESWPANGYAWYDWDTQPRSRVRPAISCDAGNTHTDPILLVRWMFPFNPHHFYTDTVLTTFMTVEHIAKVLGISSRQVKPYCIAGLVGTFAPDIWKTLFGEIQGADVLNGCYKTAFYGHMYKNVPQVNLAGVVHDPTLSSWMAAFSHRIRTGLVPQSLLETSPRGFLLVRHLRAPDWFAGVDWSIPGLQIERIDFASLPYREQIMKVAVSRGLLGVGGSGLAQHVFLPPGSFLGAIIMLEDSVGCQVRMSKTDPAHLQEEGPSLCYINTAMNTGTATLMWRWCQPDIHSNGAAFTSKQAQAVLQLLLSLRAATPGAVVRADDADKVQVCLVLDGNTESAGWPRCDQHIEAPAPCSPERCKTYGSLGLAYNPQDNSSYIARDERVKLVPYALKAGSHKWTGR